MFGKAGPGWLPLALLITQIAASGEPEHERYWLPAQGVFGDPRQSVVPLDDGGAVLRCQLSAAAPAGVLGWIHCLGASLDRRTCHQILLRYGPDRRESQVARNAVFATGAAVKLQIRRRDGRDGQNPVFALDLFLPADLTRLGSYACLIYSGVVKPELHAVEGFSVVLPVSTGLEVSGTAFNATFETKGAWLGPRWSATVLLVTRSSNVHYLGRVDATAAGVSGDSFVSFEAEGERARYVVHGTVNRTFQGVFLELRSGAGGLLARAAVDLPFQPRPRRAFAWLLIPLLTVAVCVAGPRPGRGASAVCILAASLLSWAWVKVLE